MTKTTRHLMVGLMMTGVAGAGRPAVAGDAEPPAISRVRSNSHSIVALISQASEQSKTFRSMVDTINSSNAIVYVEEGTCGHGVRACFVTVTMAGPMRLLWVRVDMRKRDSDLMASIGHELRHTIEVLGARMVTDGNGLFMFYSRIGLRGKGKAFETTAAVEAGTLVENEIRSYQSRSQVR